MNETEPQKCNVCHQRHLQLPMANYPTTEGVIIQLWSCVGALGKALNELRPKEETKP